MKMQWTLIFALLFALIIALFAVVNVNPVPVSFVYTQTELPLILVILGSTLLGGLVVGLFGIIRQYRLQRTIKQLNKRIAELETAAEPAAPDASDTEGSGAVSGVGETAGAAEVDGSPDRNASTEGAAVSGSANASGTLDEGGLGDGNSTASASYSVAPEDKPER